MNLKKISFKNFKSLYDTSFEPGRINVFIGANGYGKSTILEAIGLSVEWRQDTERFQYNVSQVPPVFAVDSFDHALNPRLAKKIMQVFCQ